MEKQNKRLSLNQNEDIKSLMTGKRRNGSAYTVRKDRRRYFFPDEWEKFIALIHNKTHRFFFITCLFTGGRMMEVLNLKYENIDPERQIIRFDVVKKRKAKRDYSSLSKSRSFFVPGNFMKEYKSFIRGRNINPTDYIFLDNEKLPPNFGELENAQRKKYYVSKAVSYAIMLKRKLIKAGIKDWYNFSPHNLRKTYGMWSRVFNKEMLELCYRMGHDTNTYLTHYGSSLIFTDEERRKIQEIFGDFK